MCLRGSYGKLYLSETESRKACELTRLGERHSHNCVFSLALISQCPSLSFSVQERDTYKTMLQNSVSNNFETVFLSFLQTVSLFLSFLQNSDQAVV